jgi:hypothetical protein
LLDRIPILNALPTPPPTPLGHQCGPSLTATNRAWASLFTID